MLLLDAMATMMPVTVNVNRFATHMPNTSPALTYAACYNTSWILRPSTKNVGDKPLLSVSIFVQAVQNNVLLAVPALLYAIKNYIRFTKAKPLHLHRWVCLLRIWEAMIVKRDGEGRHASPGRHATMMPVTVNVNRFATHMPNTSPALTYAACYNTSWILRPSTKKVGDKPLLSVSIFVQAVRNNVLLAVPALLYAIKNYIRFTPPPPCLLSLDRMSRWLKLDMGVASAALRMLSVWRLLK
ncbi:unnamed protein product [Brassica napus]|uniref:(rape) hypothetical protein n=1 Tax=Brassica napus TaxID=3708 RepID=A0A816J8X1_BRANA|nr:unnamed protein product [Brassica napus]